MQTVKEGKKRQLAGGGTYIGDGKKPKEPQRGGIPRSLLERKRALNRDRQEVRGARVAKTCYNGNIPMKQLVVVFT